MKGHLLLTPLLVISFITSYGSVATAQSRTIGKYRGSVYSADRHVPVVTTFYLDSRGEIAGSYVIEDGSTTTSGTLSNFTAIGEDSAKFTWQDKFGSGKLRILFSSNLEQFNGFWGTDNRTNYHWSGTREVFTQVAERRPVVTDRSPSTVRSTRPDSDAVKKAIVKILGATVANAFAAEQDKNDGLFAALLSTGARAGRDKLIESALQDVFPERDGFEIRSVRRVIALYLDKKLSLEKLGAETAKEEIIEALQEENPNLGASLQVVDFIYELHQANSH